MQNSASDKFGGDHLGRERADEGLTDRAGGLVHDIGNAAMESGKSALHGLQDGTREMTKNFAALYEDGAVIVRKRVARQPIAALAIAMAAGALITRLVFRK